MAYPDTIVASYRKQGTRLALGSSISATPNLEWELIDTSFKEVWPHPNKSLVKHGISANGKALRPAQNFTLGRAEPMASISSPLTVRSFGILMQSLWQHEGWDSVDSYAMLPYNTHAKSVCDMFMSVEAGIAGQGIYKGVGGVASSVTLTFPPVDAELGKCTISADIMFANASRTTAYSSGTPTIDPGTPILTSAIDLALDGSGVPFVSGSVSLSNNLAKGLNAGDTPDYFALGDLSVTGEAVVILSNTTDTWETLMDAHEAKTVVELVFSNSGVLNISLDALLGPPSFQEQGNVFLVRFPFEAVYVDATRPSASVTTGTDIFNWS